jgi:hypothetical protein
MFINLMLSQGSGKFREAELISAFDVPEIIGVRSHEAEKVTVADDHPALRERQGHDFAGDDEGRLLGSCSG